MPRDIGGRELAGRLHHYGFIVSRQSGSHMRLTSDWTGTEHHVTVPTHDYLRVGTLNAVLDDVAAYLGMEKEDLECTLFD